MLKIEPLKLFSTYKRYSAVEIFFLIFDIVKKCHFILYTA